MCLLSTPNVSFIKREVVEYISEYPVSDECLSLQRVSGVRHINMLYVSSEFSL